MLPHMLPHIQPIERKYLYTVICGVNQLNNTLTTKQLIKDFLVINTTQVEILLQFSILRQIYQITGSSMFNLLKENT